MIYETQNYIGGHHPAQAVNTEAVTSTARRIRPLDAETKRRRPGAERQAESSADSNASSGILRCTFLPKLHKAESVQSCQEIESDFYQSLSKVAEHYSIEPMESKQYGCPYNMALAVWDIETKLRRECVNWDSIRLLTGNQKTHFVSEEKYETGQTLYYIPVVPLYAMLHNPRHKKNAQLLISVYSYLYHIADIPYYRQENSYLYWIYEMHKEWVEQDDESEDSRAFMREFEIAETIGDSIEQKLFNRINLEVFEQRLRHFKCRDAFDEECLKTARKAFSLYNDYPDTDIFRNAPILGKDPDSDYYDTEVIGMEKYISFIAETKGWLYENLSDSINNEFNEYGGLQEPTIYKPFDRSEVVTADLHFENRLFDLLDYICDLLYNYKTTES